MIIDHDDFRPQACLLPAEMAERRLQRGWTIEGTDDNSKVGRLLPMKPEKVKTIER